jgi:ribose transport system permease protein
MKSFLSDYGSIFVLILLCAYYSVVTWGEQHPHTPAAGRALARTIVAEHGVDASVVILVRDTTPDRAFARAVESELLNGGVSGARTVSAATPAEARQALEAAAADLRRIDVIATHDAVSRWGPLQPDRIARLAAQHPGLGGAQVVKPTSYHWPSFLTRENLLNVVNQNADIAIIAIGMTLVIITAGIDLSVGSLLALSGVVTAVAIQHWAGGAAASRPATLACGLLGVGLCAACGAFSGSMTTVFRIPAFVVTLAMMMVARGLALIIAVRYQQFLKGGATAGTPEAVRIAAPGFDQLGNGQCLGIPNPIWLMLALYVAAHVVMTRTALGRYIYAVGGNAEAARLSGVPVRGVLVLVYALCAAMAGLGGIVDASRFAGGRPNAGEFYELQVIAAVVVGGTSLAGGEGRVFGTLIGALIIAVIQNGLNMAGVTPYEQMIVFGGLILAAALLDQLKKRLWRDAG